MFQIVHKLLIANKIFSVSKEDIRLQLLTHTEYPSIRSLTDTLDFLGVANIAANVPKEALSRIPESFLALMDLNNSSQVCLVQKGSHKFIVTDSQGKSQKLTETEFYNKWANTIIAVEKDERPSKSNGFTLRVLTLALLIGLTFTLFYKFETTYFLGLLLAMLGILLSILTIREDLGYHQGNVQKICGLISKNSGCDGILKSRGSKIFNISLGDTALIYFVGLTLIEVLINQNESIILLLSLMTIPAILYSLIFQIYIIKQWCALCLGIVAVLVLNLSTRLITSETLEFSYVSVFQTIFIFSLVGLIWLKTRKLLDSQSNLKRTQAKYFNLKRNFKVFSKLYDDGPALDIQAEGKGLEFGNKNAPVRLVSITNPLCGFCAETFEDYDKILERSSEDVRIFLISNVGENKNIDSIIARRIIELYQISPLSSWDALRQWFLFDDISKWVEVFGEPKDDSIAEKILKSQRTWCLENSINHTPVSFLNNRLFPKEFSVIDLYYFIDDFKKSIIVD